jgi:hypothetical protein
MSLGMNLFDTARCRARIAAMQDEELDDYILRVKTRLMHSHEDSYFLEESLLQQLGEACEERRRRQSRFASLHHRQHPREHRHEVQQGAD